MVHEVLAVVVAVAIARVFRPKASVQLPVDCSRGNSTERKSETTC